MIRFRLRTVLVGLSLIVMILPLAGIQILRLYESALVRQTESELLAQGVFVTAMYRRSFQAMTESQAEPAHQDFRVNSTKQISGELDLATTEIQPSFTTIDEQEPPDPVARAIGLTLEPVLVEASKITFAEIYVSDHHGRIVATTESALEQSIDPDDPINAVFSGTSMSQLRRISTEESPGFIGFGSGSNLAVLVALPIIENGTVIGAVVLSRPPPNIFTALYAKRLLLLEAAGVLLAVVVLISIFTSRTVVNPIQRLAKEADLVARGKQQTFDDNHVYRTLEVDQLAKRLKEMADALQLRSHYIRDFARHVSHEFKTPIAAIKGAAEVLEDHAGDMTAQERAKFMGNVRSDLARLERLTNGLLELATAEMSRATDVSCVLADVAGEFRRASIDGATRTPMAIPEKNLGAILTHLIKNAEQHGAHSIEIHSAIVGQQLQIDVTDDGEGITDSNKHLVFDPFFTTYRDGGGTGLGLSIARAIARNADGDLDYIAEAVGTGTTFRLAIPLARSHDQFNP